jgi:Arc/MetJ-type ribon-helix-helix transcriptional regulator
MKTISLKLPEDLLAKVQDAAKKRGETMSAVIRESLDEFLAKEKDHILRSCLDHALDLAGRVQGPPDLSTNPAHMDHYGR